MRRAVREYRAPFFTILVFAALSVVAGVYVLGQQRTQLPFTERYEVQFTFTDTAGLVPGLGQPVQVAGVRVGAITKTRVQGGGSLVTVSIDRKELPAVFRDASAVLRPRTALQDLQIDLIPGHPRAGRLPEDQPVEIPRTAVPVKANNILKALDGDTREYFVALMSSLGLGLRDRGGDLRRLYKAIGPTADQVTELSTAVNRRRKELARVVHAFSVLAVAAGERDQELRAAVADGSRTLRAMASQDGALRASLERYPATLSAARRALDDGQDLAVAARPALTRLAPAFQRLPAALRATDRLAATATPALRRGVRPLTRASIPVLGQLPATGRRLNAVTPDLSTTFKVLEHFLNELAYNDGGKSKGFAHWGAWTVHNLLSLQQMGDANSSVIRGTAFTSCSAGLAATDVGAQLLGIPQLSGVVNELGSLAKAVCPGPGDDEGKG